MDENILIEKLSDFAKEQTLLIVDDEESTGNSIKMLTSSFYKRVDIAFNGREALDLYKQNRYDIVLTDIVMPTMNGITLSKELKKINENQTIIVTSAHDDVEHLQDLINIGVDMFIKKPINKSLINSLFKQSEKIHNAQELQDLKKEFKEEIERKKTYIIASIESKNLRKDLKKRYNDIDFVESGDIVKSVSLKEPNTIIMDDTIQYARVIFKEIKSNPLTRHIPILMITSNNNIERSKEFISLGIEEIIPKELPSKLAIELIDRIIKREIKSNSSAAKFIRGIQVYNHCTHHGINLRTISKVVSHKLGFSKEVSYDIKSFVSLLATSIEKDNIADLLLFFKNMRFVKTFIKYLELLDEPTDLYGEAIKAIFYRYKAQYTHKNYSLSGVREDVITIVDEAIDNNSVIIQKPIDLDFLLTLTDNFFKENPEIDNFHKSILHRVLKPISSTLILNKISIYAHTVFSDSSIVITLEPLENREFSYLLEDIEIPENFEISKRENCVVITQNFEYTQGLSKKPNIKEKTPEVVVQVQQEEVILEPQTTNATDFLNMLQNENTDLSLLDELAELEDDLDTVVSRDILDLEAIEETHQILYNYTRFIETLMEFETITTSMFSLASAFEKVSQENTPPSTTILPFIDAIRRDLQNWRNGIFVYKTVEDIHFLDASLASNCSQIEMFLGHKKNSSEAEDENMLFFI